MNSLLRFLSFGLLSVSALTAADNFGDTLRFLQAHQKPVVLKSADGAAQVIVSPEYQGRVMTSTATGEKGLSFGWINRELIASGELQPHMNAFGGEDRLWLGPEGGPYALYFAPGTKEQTFANWQTPAVIDTEAWKVERVTSDTVGLSARAVLKNRRGSEFIVAFSRTVRLLSASEVHAGLGVSLPAKVDLVAYESDNRISNAGPQAWTKDQGLPSIWILGMFTPGEKTTVVIPLKKSAATAAEPVRSDYFGKIASDRLQVVKGVAYLRADGKSRGKLGVPPAYATALAGSWDPVKSVLTIVHFDLPIGAASLPYVDSRWIDMDDPYAGDVLNAYNDGSPAPGVAPLGPFYEIESSSPAAALKPGEEMRHRHRTMHFLGAREALDGIARGVLGVSLDEIERAFVAE